MGATIHYKSITTKLEADASKNANNNGKGAHPGTTKLMTLPGGVQGWGKVQSGGTNGGLWSTLTAC